MFVGKLTDSEIETLCLALKFWRHHRRDTPTRRGDQILSPDDSAALLAKLDNARRAGRTADGDPVPETIPH